MTRSPDAGVRIVLVDGQRLGREAAALAATDPGVMRGDGVFEAFLSDSGRPPAWLAWHDARLRRSAELVGFGLEGRGLREELPELLELLRAEATGLWRVRYTVLRGAGGLRRIWTAGPAQERPEQVDLALSAFRRDPFDPLSGAKTVSRVRAEVARRAAERAGAWDALLPTIDGDLAECTAANLLVWRGDRLETPSLDRGILGGVTRQAVLAACRVAGIPIFEGRIFPQQAESAEEIYVTNAVVGLIPVRKILGLREDLPGAAGTRLREVRAAYQDLRAGETAGPSAVEN